MRGGQQCCCRRPLGLGSRGGVGRLPHLLRFVVKGLCARRAPPGSCCCLLVMLLLLLLLHMWYRRLRARWPTLFGILLFFFPP